MTGSLSTDNAQKLLGKLLGTMVTNGRGKRKITVLNASVIDMTLPTSLNGLLVSTTASNGDTDVRIARLIARNLVDNVVAVVTTLARRNLVIGLALHTIYYSKYSGYVNQYPKYYLVPKNQ